MLPVLNHLPFDITDSSNIGTNGFHNSEHSKELKVSLVSSDGEQFIIDKEVASRSEFLKGMLDYEPSEIQYMDDTQGEVTLLEVKLENIHSQTLFRVVGYLTDRQVNFDVDGDTLGKLILAADFLDIKSLLTSACMVAADKIRGKTVSEIRAYFGKFYLSDEKEESHLSQTL